MEEELERQLGRPTKSLRVRWRRALQARSTKDMRRAKILRHQLGGKRLKVGLPISVSGLPTKACRRLPLSTTRCRPCSFEARSIREGQEKTSLPRIERRKRAIPLRCELLSF